MLPPRSLLFPVLSAVFLLACGSSNDAGSTGVTKLTSGSGGGGSAGGASGTGGHSAGEATGAGTSGDGATSTGSGGATSTGVTGSGGSIIQPDAGPSDAGSSCKHLNIGILGNPGSNPSSNFATWLTMAGTSVKRIQTTATEPLTQTTLQAFDVIVLDWLTRDYTSAEASILSGFVTAGGGVVSMTGYDNNTTDDWHANSLLSPLGVGYAGPLLSGPVTSFAPHPITAGLTSVTFSGGYGIADLGGGQSTRTPVAFVPNDNANVPVGYAVQMGTGHAFVWGDEWIEFDSEWSTLPEIKQMWVQIFGWVSPQNSCGLVPVQ